MWKQRIYHNVDIGTEVIYELDQAPVLMVVDQLMYSCMCSCPSSVSASTRTGVNFQGENKLQL